MFQRATISSQVFIKTKPQHTKNVQKQKFYSNTFHFVEDSLLSQADICMTQHQPLWSCLLTRPLQTPEFLVSNRAIGLITLFGPLSKYSTFPSQVVKHWSLNKNTKQSLIWHGNFIYQNKKVETDKPSILIQCKKKKDYNNKTFRFFSSLIRTQYSIALQNWTPKFQLHSKDLPFKVRVLPKNTALKVHHFFLSSPKNQKSGQFSTKKNYLYEKSFFEVHIDLFSSSTKTTKKAQTLYKINSKQKNILFLDLLKQGSEKSPNWLNQAWFICDLMNTQENTDWRSRNYLTASSEPIHLKKRLLVFKKDEKKYPTQLIADVPNLKNQYTESQIKKHNYVYNFQKTINNNKFQKKHCFNYYNKKAWEKTINSCEINSQWTKKLYKSIYNQSKNKIYYFFYTWKKFFLEQPDFHCSQKKHLQYQLDQQSLLKLSHFFDKTLSVRGNVYPNFILAPSLQLIGIEIWWAFFIACGMGLVLQHKADPTIKPEVHQAISLSPLSIWNLYWNQKSTQSFWPQMTKSFYLRTNSWIQPRFLQLKNLFAIGISPLVALSVQLELINWMSFEVGHRVVNIIECLENFTEILYDKITVTSINFHTRTNSVLVQQLNKTYRLSNRLGPSYDAALVPIVSSPITQFALFLIRYVFYNVVWWTLVPLRLVAFFFSLGWKVWLIVPLSVKNYFRKRANEQRFQWTLERAINHKGMFAGAQHTLDHPGVGTFVAKRIRLMNLFFRMSNICDAELSPIAGIEILYHAGVRDTLVPKSSLFIEPIGSRRNEWFQLASDHWRLPLIHLKLDSCFNKDSMSMSGKRISTKLFGKTSAEKSASTSIQKGGQKSNGGGGASAISRGGNSASNLNPLFQVIRKGEVLNAKAKLPSMDRPQTIAEDYIIRHFMVATAAIPCIFVVDGLNLFYETQHSKSYLAVRELRERSALGGLSYEEKLFGFFPNSGYLTIDYWDILGMPNQLEKEAEEEDYELEELEDDPPEIREAKLALQANIGEQPSREWVALPPEGGITGWEIMKLIDSANWNPFGTLLYLLWLLDKFPRTRYGIRFGVGNLLTIKEPLLRKRRWNKVYTMKGFNWVDRERILQSLMINMGSLRLQGQALEQVLPRSQGYTLAEMHSFANEMALCKAQTNLHLKWGKEWSWDDSLLLKKINKPHKPASGSDAASNFFLWQRATYLQDLHQLTSDSTFVEKALRSLMRQEQASMSSLAPYYFFEDGRAHIFRHLSKWMVDAFFFPGITRFPAYNAGDTRFRYSYLDRFALEEPPYSISYRRDPTSTAAWSEIIRSLSLIAGGDLYYECVENHSQQQISKEQRLAHRKSINRQLKQIDKQSIEVCWQLLWALVKQNPLLPLTDPLHSFHKRVIKSLYKNKSYDTFFLINDIGIAQAREESTLSLYKSLPLLLFRFPGINEEDILGGKEPFATTISLLPYIGWERKMEYYDEFRPITMSQPSIQVMVKDEELLHLNYVWEPLLVFIFYMLRPHFFQHEEQINPDEYGRPLEVSELREVQDNKTGAALLIQSGGSSLKEAPTDLELREFVTNFLTSYEDIQLEEERVWHLDASVPKTISFDDLHFLHAWIPFFQWTYNEKNTDPICIKVWVAPYNRLHRLATYVESYVLDDLPAIHQRVFGLDPADPHPEKSWDIQMQNLKENKWKANDKRVEDMWMNFAKMPKLTNEFFFMLKEHTDLLTTPEWIRGREYRRKIRMKKRTKKLLSNPFDRADPHAESIEDPATLAAEPLHLTAIHRAEIITSGMLISGHESGLLWRNSHAVSTGMHRGWDLTYSTSDLRWLLFNEPDRSESEFYTILYEIEKIINCLIVWTWPHLQSVFSLMQSRAAWAQEETQRSDWKLNKLSYSAKLECGRTAARLEADELTAIIWNSSASNLKIQTFPGSLPFHFLKNELADQINKKKAEANSLFHSSDFAGRLAYNKPGWRGEERFFKLLNKQ
nr:hypothetical protein [Klebsormidium dissectum]WKT07656.1 hypothetical protein [Klebsormidium sp. SEV1-VF17pt]